MNLSEIKQYVPAQLCTGKEWYIYFYAFNPELNKLQRKRVKINTVKNKVERRKYALNLINQFNIKLSQGWNPFIDPEAKKSYTRLSEAVKHFINIAERKLNDDAIREETYRDYVSSCKNFQQWLNDKKYGDLYVYKLDKSLVTQFLDYIYVEKKRAVQTRNNYLNQLRILDNFLVENSYLKTRFTDGVNAMKKRPKQRTVIAKDDLKRIREYWQAENPYYGLAIEVLYYCFIRPKEMSFLQIKHIQWKEGTIYLPKEFTKNRKDAIITIPDVLGKMLIDLHIHEFPLDYYLFSNDFKPGPEKRSEKFFRDHWLRMRKKLKLPATYVFYSLKDTGITDMLTETNDTLAVRDQARHSSISITDIYTDKTKTTANEKIKRYK